MTTLDIHPEHLMDKDDAGSLSDGERARLEGHLDHCRTCRFERASKRAFRAELDGGTSGVSRPRIPCLRDGAWVAVPARR